MSMNGSVDKLAEGFRAVIQDIVSPVNEEIKVVKGDIEALLDELSKMESRVTVRIEETGKILKIDLGTHGDRINENVQAQLAQHRADVSRDFEKTLSSRG